MEKTKILPSSWKTSINRWLKPKADLPPRLAILGIGNTFRSDDAAGILVARRMLHSSFLRELEHVLVIDSGHAPENSTAELRRFGPELILLIDAAQMDEEPGTIRLINMDELDGMSASTHSLPLSMLATYLMLELDCDIKLLGIQLQTNEVGECVCPPVMQAVDEVAATLNAFLGFHAEEIVAICKSGAF